MPTAAKVLVDTLVAHKIDRAFCVPGESYLAVMDALHNDPVLDLVTCRHEGGAAWMALGFPAPARWQLLAWLPWRRSQRTPIETVLNAGPVSIRSR